MVISNKLIEATKEAMNYTENAGICKNCEYFIREYDELTGWELTCSFSNLCSFPVQETGYCIKFKNKEK